MEWCVTFPKEPVQMYRPSLRKACGGNRNAGKLLSYLLYRSSIREEAKTEARNINEVRKQQGLEPNQDMTITVYRTQSQIIEEMDEELCDRTLRDDAIPCLVALGYLTIEETKGNKNYTAYTIYPDAIQEGINHSEKIPSYKEMPYYVALQASRKKFRTEKIPTLSEMFPKDRGNVSERKSNTKEASKADVQGKTQTTKSNYKITSQDNITSNKKPQKPETPKVVPIKPQLTLEGQQVYHWYAEVRGKKPRLTDKNIVACNNLASIDGMSLQNLKDVIDTLDKTPFIIEKGLTVDLVNLEREDYYYNFEKTLAIVERNRKNTRTSAPTGKPKRTPEEERRYQLFMQAQDGMKRTGTGGK